MAQILKPLELGLLTIIILIGIIALATELTEYEVAKVVVVPSLVLLILVTGYGIFKASYLQR